MKYCIMADHKCTAYSASPMTYMVVTNITIICVVVSDRRPVFRTWVFVCLMVIITFLGTGRTPFPLPEQGPLLLFVLLTVLCMSRSWWLWGLRLWSAATCMLGSRVTIPLRAWVFVSCVCWERERERETNCVWSINLKTRCPRLDLDFSATEQ